MASTDPNEHAASCLHIRPIYEGATRVVWSLMRGGKPVVTDIAENRKAARRAARQAFVNELIKNIPPIDGSNSN